MSQKSQAIPGASQRLGQNGRWAVWPTYWFLLAVLVANSHRAWAWTGRFRYVGCPRGLPTQLYAGLIGALFQHCHRQREVSHASRRIWKFPRTKKLNYLSTAVPRQCHPTIALQCWSSLSVRFSLALPVIGGKGGCAGMRRGAAGVDCV